MRVFAGFQTFWEDEIGAHEAYHFSKLYDWTGVMPFLDTDVTVEIVKPPHFPLDNKPAADKGQYRKAREALGLK